MPGTGFPGIRKEARRSDWSAAKSHPPRGAGRLRRGLIGKEQSLELPERAHRALDTLSELRAIFDGLYELAGNPTKPVTADDIVQTRRNIREPTKVGEREARSAPMPGSPWRPFPWSQS
jgi:hypothetical protein